MSRKGLYGLASKVGEVAAINWYPGHMASATKAIRDRIKFVDLVLEVRDARVRKSLISIHQFLTDSFLLIRSVLHFDQVIQ